MKQFLFTFLALAGAAAAFAQGPPPPPGGGTFVFPGRAEAFHMAWKPVLNAPYTASTETDTVQTLADGNTIQNSHTSTVARDSQGRIRTETTINRIGPWASASGPKTVIFISDPVAGYSYVLHPDTMIADRLPIPPPPPAGAKPRGERGGPRGSGGSSNATAESLGTQTMDGVPADGKRVTHTIPAGAIGNTMPLVSVTETWFSPDLHIVLSSKRTDPQFGNETYTVTNLQRGEPSADLFQVPAGYTIQNAPKRGMRRNHP